MLPSSVKRGDYLAIYLLAHTITLWHLIINAKPPVFFLKDGKAREVIKRQSLRQLIINDTK